MTPETSVFGLVHHAHTTPAKKTNNLIRPYRITFVEDLYLLAGYQARNTRIVQERIPVVMVVKKGSHVPVERIVILARHGEITFPFRAVKLKSLMENRFN
jgi:hypothetical protein